MHQLQIYYIDHRQLTLPDPDSPGAAGLYTGTAGTMRRAGQKLAPKYAIRKLSKRILYRQVLHLEDESVLVIGPHGKPSFPQEILSSQPFFFNISHGRDYSVLAVSDRNLGVDIQEIPEEDPVKEQKRSKRRDLVAGKTFPPAFLAVYESLKSENASACEQREVFTRLWTQVEAILKAEGSGFSLDLRKHSELLEKWTLHNVKLQDHIITAAMEGEFEISAVTEIFP